MRGFPHDTSHNQHLRLISGIAALALHIRHEQPHCETCIHPSECSIEASMECSKLYHSLMMRVLPRFYTGKASPERFGTRLSYAGPGSSSPTRPKYSFAQKRFAKSSVYTNLHTTIMSSPRVHLFVSQACMTFSLQS